MTVLLFALAYYLLAVMPVAVLIVHRQHRYRDIKDAAAQKRWDQKAWPW